MKTVLAMQVVGLLHYCCLEHHNSIPGLCLYRTIPLDQNSRQVVGCCQHIIDRVGVMSNWGLELVRRRLLLLIRRAMLGRLPLLNRQLQRWSS